MEKKTPERMCSVCRGMFDKRALLRVVRTPEGEFVIDETGKKSGRGAYVCRQKACLTKCAKTRALNRAFKGDVPAELYERLLGMADE